LAISPPATAAMKEKVVADLAVEAEIDKVDEAE
jgi:hypothetical protein